MNYCVKPEDCLLHFMDEYCEREGISMDTFIEDLLIDFFSKNLDKYPDLHKEFKEEMDLMSDGWVVKGNKLWMYPKRAKIEE